MPAHLDTGEVRIVCKWKSKVGCPLHRSCPKRFSISKIRSLQGEAHVKEMMAKHLYNSTSHSSVKTMDQARKVVINFCALKPCIDEYEETVEDRQEYREWHDSTYGAPADEDDEEAAAEEEEEDDQEAEEGEEEDNGENDTKRAKTEAPAPIARALRKEMAAAMTSMAKQVGDAVGAAVAQASQASGSTQLAMVAMPSTQALAVRRPSHAGSACVIRPSAAASVPSSAAHNSDVVQVRVSDLDALLNSITRSKESSAQMITALRGMAGVLEGMEAQFTTEQRILAAQEEVVARFLREHGL